MSDFIFKQISRGEAGSYAAMGFNIYKNVSRRVIPVTNEGNRVTHGSLFIVAGEDATLQAAVGNGEVEITQSGSVPEKPKKRASKKAAVAEVEETQVEEQPAETVEEPAEEILPEVASEEEIVDNEAEEV
jgi:hypothetical protein